MTHVFDAVFEHGTFRLLAQSTPPLAEGQQVRISVELDSPESMLGLAARVYEGLSEQEINDVEQIALDRSTFFTKPSA